MYKFWSLNLRSCARWFSSCLQKQNSSKNKESESVNIKAIFVYSICCLTSYTQTASLFPSSLDVLSILSSCLAIHVCHFCSSHPKKVKENVSLILFELRCRTHSIGSYNVRPNLFGNKRNPCQARESQNFA